MIATFEGVALDRCLAVLRRGPAGLFTDIDGTISAIAPTPAAAVVTEAARDALRLLADRLAVVGVVTGRSADDAFSMIELPEVIVVGNHGMERRHRNDRWIHPTAEASQATLAAALDEVQTMAIEGGFAVGLIFENKHLTASIHYRLSDDPLTTRERILDAVEIVADRHGLSITEGRFVVELRPKVVVNKGTAIADIARLHDLAGVVYLGDDVTDVDAFVAVKSLRESGEVATVSVAVLSPETHASVLKAADVTVDGVDSSIALIAAIGEALDPLEP
jgi:trehalose 6-phosphate phosphatase